MRRAIAATLLLLSTAGCSGDSSSLPPPPDRQLSVVEGTAQVGRPDEPLPRPVVVALEDPHGDPVAGAVVTFAADAGSGSLVNATGITDAHGRTAAVWIIGSAAGTQHLHVRADEADELVVTATAGTPPCWLATCLDVLLNGPVPFVPVVLHTYDGGDQAVHPDLLFRGGEHLPLAMVYTPYPFGNAAFEDPSLVESGNGRHWQVPDRVSNPLARSTGGYLSDPDIVTDPDNHLERIYYREVVGGRNRIHLLDSGDGTTWTPRGVVLDVPSHQAISPAVVAGAPAAPWQLWSVNAGSAGCTAQATTVERRTSDDGRQWGAPVTTDLHVPGQVVWHLDVEWLPGRGEYWALMNTYAEGGSCVTQALFLATSTDGLHWQPREQPLLVAGSVPPFKDVVYRSTFRVSDDGMWVELLLSGAELVEQGYRWSIGRMVVATSEALAGSLLSNPLGDSWHDPTTTLPVPEPFDLPDN